MTPAKKTVPARRASPKKRPSLRVAAIDIGSNSSRMRIADVGPGNRISILADRRIRTRLGSDLARSGRIPAQGLAAFDAAIDSFAAEIKGDRVNKVVAVATAAARESSNGSELVAIAAKHGITLEIIDSEREGRLAFLGISSKISLKSGCSAVIDIGGGSAQVILSVDGMVCRCVSMPLGAVRLTQQFGGPTTSSRSRFAAMRSFVRATIESALTDWNRDVDLVVGTGGTLTTAAAMHEACKKGPPHPVAVPTLSLTSDILKPLEKLRRLPAAARGDEPGVPLERADIIVAGLTVAAELLNHLGASTFRTVEGGIREGIIIEAFEKESSAAAVTPEEAALRLAYRCDDDMPHSRHVAKLCTRIVESLPLAMRPSRREQLLLRLAAELHDIGVFVEYEKHHKHSWALIRNARLPGLTTEELAIVAAIARYHRKSLPRPTHAELADLSRPSRAVVSRLAAILRIADGLDRSHEQRVSDVRIAIRKGQTQCFVLGQGDCSTEILAARKKSDLWKKVLGPIEFSRMAK
jgi:exopolyphosphatase/guanosine-5'-triphosphate,3'-diphosphate pyrophosphatase